MTKGIARKPSQQTKLNKLKRGGKVLLRAHKGVRFPSLKRVRRHP
jgi:hypothetical protein